MYLFLDTETTGLPRSWRAPVSELENWPRLVQIAWARFDARHRHLQTKACIVRPEGFTIPREAQRVHGISTKRAIAEGRPLPGVLRRFAAAAAKARVVVAHNLRFDEAVIAAEFLRLGLGVPLAGKRRVCTMLEATDYCGIPSWRGYKWPTLSELHASLFGLELEEAHNAEADVTTCAKCFFELKRRRIIKMSSGRVKRWRGPGFEGGRRFHRLP